MELKKMDDKIRVTLYCTGDRLAWPAGPQREAGEGVVEEALPPTATDPQPRYRIRRFIGAVQTDETLDLAHGVVTLVPRWESHMDREERLRYHRGSATGWNEPI
jgi:hypothetical protein